MDCVYIEFIPDNGLVFYKQSLGNKTKVHEVKIETLMKMSLSDLDYCISTNAFLELKGMHGIFGEYLWSEDGEIKPQKDRDQPR